MERGNDLLKQAGYFVEREVDISDILQMYEEYGYHYNTDQETFMKKYAGLEIHYNHPIWKQDMLLRLDPIKAQRPITMDVVEEYNEFLKDDLLIIGDRERKPNIIFV
ncbi:MAG: hypothetical protein HDR11_16940 [Lachnospiraceae bacterium]|nr:hypothetical protein [Lachnospiraceae bacterium]